MTTKTISGTYSAGYTLSSQYTALTLTASGGVIGILVGWLLSFTIRTLVPSLPSTVPLWSVVAGFAVATGVGLFFGLWPALKAARLDPIAALRYE